MDSLSYKKEINWFSTEVQVTDKKDRCTTCGANMKSNCKAHAVWCPNYCNNNQVPIGDGLDILLFLGIFYMICKTIFTKK